MSFFKVAFWIIANMLEKRVNKVAETFGFVATKDYWSYYARRFGTLAAAGTMVGVFALYGFATPSAATVSGSTAELSTFTEKSLGGVELLRQELNAVEKAKLPDVDESQKTAIVISPDLETITTAETGENLRFVGTFKITHYCACSICCGPYASGKTATGKQVAEGMVAADWNVFPPGTVIYIKRGDSVVQKVVEDRGGGVNGNHIDVYVPTHEGALQLGTYTADVYVAA